MSLIRWKPFRTIEHWEPSHDVKSMRRDMDRMFDWLTSSFDGGLGEGRFMPSVEMDETDDEIHLKLEVPGLKAEDLDIGVTEDSVAIRGERKSEEKTEKNGMVRSEFRYGQFERVIPLPAYVQSDKVEAEYEDGILNLTLPKAEEEKKRVVKVKVGS
ncbi:MAG: Hsp20/alpha crystallin family protein [Elainellaceae cyanobacterium]